MEPDVVGAVDLDDQSSVADSGWESEVNVLISHCQLLIEEYVGGRRIAERSAEDARADSHRADGDQRLSNVRSARHGRLSLAQHT